MIRTSSLPMELGVAGLFPLVKYDDETRPTSRARRRATPSLEVGSRDWSSAQAAPSGADAGPSVASVPTPAEREGGDDVAALPLSPTSWVLAAVTTWLVDLHAPHQPTASAIQMADTGEIYRGTFVLLRDTDGSAWMWFDATQGLYLGARHASVVVAADKSDGQLVTARRGLAPGRST